MTFTIELYTQGSPTPVAVMHGCRKLQHRTHTPVSYNDGTTYGGFIDADGKEIVFCGLNAIMREE